ncbi:MAG: glutamate formimidoyltransferase [Acholeplasmataceae bacterium]
MTKIVQCVPNISEGRDIKKIEYIIEPLKNQAGFKLVSYEPDKDYNRTVVTLLGDPEAMLKPLVEFFKRAKEKIDMNKHQGEHPRMGAVDVTPFIPIANIKIAECVEHAKALASMVWEEEIPVFLYARAAQDPNRESLPNIRKGEFEGMKEKIKDPIWKPDYGKNEIHPTFGVAAIGARIPLIAYNIDLNTNDENIPKEIAKHIRQSSGGFQYVQAGPASLTERGHVQITMNILDVGKNPIYRIFETVRMEAKRYNVNIMSSEVVGLIPKKALLSTIQYYCERDQIEFDPNMTIGQIVELGKKYLSLRDFEDLKIVEANL